MRVHSVPVIIVMVVLGLVLQALPASAQVSDQDCSRYGCLYEHCGYERAVDPNLPALMPGEIVIDFSLQPDHFVRADDTPRPRPAATWAAGFFAEGCPLGIAREFLPDGGELNRTFIRVLWPGRYDPARRAAWDRLAFCESTLRWDYSGPGYYDGGLQFDPGTWLAFGGGQYARYAYNAYPEQQIAIAEVTLSNQSRNAWPGCLRKGQGAPYPQ